MVSRRRFRAREALRGAIQSYALDSQSLPLPLLLSLWLPHPHPCPSPRPCRHLRLSLRV